MPRMKRRGLFPSCRCNREAIRSSISHLSLCEARKTHEHTNTQNIRGREVDANKKARKSAKNTWPENQKKKKKKNQQEVMCMLPRGVDKRPSSSSFLSAKSFSCFASTTSKPNIVASTYVDNTRGTSAFYVRVPEKRSPLCARRPTHEKIAKTRLQSRTKRRMLACLRRGVVNRHV